jgi:hypothetical protein
MKRESIVLWIYVCEELDEYYPRFRDTLKSIRGSILRARDRERQHEILSKYLYFFESMLPDYYRTLCIIEEQWSQGDI